ncbi:MAG: DUF302 domain-containing protein [Chloroflexota bacterium]
MRKQFSSTLAQNKAIWVILAVAGLLFIFIILSSQPPAAVAADGPNIEAYYHDKDNCRTRKARGVKSIVSDNDFETTLANVRAEIESRPLGIFGEVDHKANAESVDLELGPTTVIIFGSPTVGTQLMQENQRIGLELPLKMLVWEDDCGTVRIDYTRPNFLKNQFRIRNIDPVFDNISSVLEAIATGAASAD